MNATELIYNSFKNKSILTTKELDYHFEDGKEAGKCFLCGKETTRGFKKKEIIKPTFTDADIAKIKDSRVVCECCAFCLNFTSLRNYALYASENIAEHPNLKRIKEIILDKNKDVPFVLCIPTSGQKWLSIKAKINYNNENINVRFENEDVLVNVDTFKYLIEKVEYLLEQGFTKTEINTLNLNSSKLLKLDNKLEIMNKIEEIQKYKNKKVFKLSVHLAQKRRKKDDIWLSNRKQKFSSSMSHDIRNI